MNALIKRLKSAPRLYLLAYLVVFGLGLGLSWRIYTLGQDVMDTTAPLSREKLPLLKEISDLKLSVVRIEPMLYQYYATRDRAAYLQRAKESKAHISQAWDVITPRFAGNHALIEFESCYGGILEIAAELDRILGAPVVDWDGARTALGKLSVESRRIDIILDQLVDAVQGEVFMSGKDADSGVSQIIQVVVGYSVAIFLGALFVGIALNARRKAELQLVEQARHDPVTGLPNRLMFEEMMARHGSAPLGLLLFGIDQFKRVLGGLGLGAGDELLRAVAQRLQSVLPRTDVAGCRVFRLEGVEFGVVLPHTSENEEFAKVGRTVHSAMETPFVVENREMYITLNCGAALYPRDSSDGITLVRNAGAALQASREQNRNRFRVYEQAMSVLALERLALENDLRRAIEKNELELHYQPQVSLESGVIIGVEALLRWRRNGQPVSPAVFIPHAEASGLIIPIGIWVLRQACLQAKIWQDAGLQPLLVAVNISPRQFQQDDFVATVAAVLDETGMPASQLELEITEGAAVQDVEHAISTLNALKQLGVHLSIDDFGTGYSSLSYLKRFRIDKLKIDQSFVRQMAESMHDGAIVAVVVELGHQLGLTVIAEGVETVEQLNRLITLNCDEIQGYYFGKPVPPAQLEEQLLAKRRLDISDLSR
ncbi:MAG: GGDEF domain-containing protein [Betaproteobacteria bacterium]|nr:GGDEF domain-containing protein [Betaproteobacteria bacterium]